MFMKRTIATSALVSMLALAVPAGPALADGAASTRNILLGVGAATYLIIQHNRKVHEKYAEYDRRQAELQSENSDAWAAYRSEKNAYSNAIAEVSDLKREVAYQHNVVEQLRHQVAMANRQHSQSFGQETAYVPPSRRAPAPAHHKSTAAASQVAMVNYGWGQL